MSTTRCHRGPDPVHATLWNTQSRVRRITTSPSAVGEWSEPVKGTPAQVALTTSSVGATTATLVITNYANSNGDVWYYKRTAPTAGDQPYGECSDGLTTGNTTVVLTGLSSGTRYTFHRL